MDGLLSKRNLITYLILAIIILAIPLTVRLVQTQLKFIPKAAGTGNIACSGPNAQEQGGICVTSSQNVDLVITSPFGPPKPSPSP